MSIVFVERQEEGVAEGCCQRVDEKRPQTEWCDSEISNHWRERVRTERVQIIFITIRNH